MCTHEVGGTPSGCGRDVDYLRALGHVLSRAVPEPCEFWGVESFIHALSSLLPLDRLPPRPVWPPGSQSHPKPSSQPADSAVHHECHLIISLATSRHPFFYRGESTLSRLFRDPSRAHSLPRHPTASTHQCGGRYCLGGRRSSSANLDPGNKVTVAAPPPKKSLPSHSRWPLVALLGPSPDADQHQAAPPPPLEPQTRAVPGAWIGGSSPFERTFHLHTSHGERAEEDGTGGMCFSCGEGTGP